MRKTTASLETQRPSNGTRITVTIPPNDYDAVRSMAKTRKVSAAWIIRDAVEKYIQTAAS